MFIPYYMSVYICVSYVCESNDFFSSHFARFSFVCLNCSFLPIDPVGFTSIS